MNDAPGGRAAQVDASVTEFRELRTKVRTDTSGIDALPRLAVSPEATSPALVRILQSEILNTQIDIYARGNAEASNQRARLTREVIGANLCLLLAGLLSAVVLAVTSGGEDRLLGFQSAIAQILGLATLALGAVGATLGYMARDQARTARWLSRRGEAEMARLAAFRVIAARAAAGGRDLALQGLAVLTTHLLDDQRNWLGARAARHRRSSEKTSLLGGLATGLTFVGGSAALIVSPASNTVWVVLAGVVGAGIAAFAANREVLLRDRANAERYEKAQVALDGLAGRVDTIVDSIAAGELQALVLFSDAVFEQLATEHKQWLDGTAQAEAVLTKLDEQIARLGKPIA